MYFFLLCLPSPSRLQRFGEESHKKSFWREEIMAGNGEKLRMKHASPFHLEILIKSSSSFVEYTFRNLTSSDYVGRKYHTARLENHFLHESKANPP